MTQSGFQPGTVEYMSPEQLLGQEIDARSDLYSLGVTFYEMLTGRLPFRRSATGSDWEIRKGHIELEPPPIPEIRPEIHPQLAAIVMRAMRKKTNDRYQSAADFLEAVVEYERNYADKTQAPQGLKGKVTQPQTAPLTSEAKKSTVMDEAATLLARPRDESASSHNSPLDVEGVIPTKPEESSPTRPPSDQAAAASPGPVSAEISRLDVARPRLIRRRRNRFGVGAEISRADATRPAQPAQSRRRWPLAVGAVGLLLAGTAAGAILFSRRSSSEIASRTEAAKVETPTPTMSPASPSPSPAALKSKPATTTAKPTPKPVEKMNYKLAQSLEQQERYDEAAKVYEDYIARSPNAPDAGVVASYLDGLKKMQDALNAAESAMKARMYPLARKHYNRALALRPESQRAKAGLDDADAKIKSSLPQRIKRGFPFDQNESPRGGARQRRPGQQERQEPPDQLPPTMNFRRGARPTPTPRERYP
jgi:tetratricopeptide (TPR) repeat protein